MQKTKQFVNFFRRHRFSLVVFASVLGFFVASCGLVALNAETLGPADARVVNIIIDGEQQVVPTRAATVGELIQKLDIKIYENDIVTPALDTQILEDDIDVEIKRARPVTVKDGATEKVVLTAHEDAKNVAKDAGITIYPEDKTEFKQPDNLLEEGIIGEVLSIDRAQAVQVNLYGAIFVHRTHVSTVSDLLKELGINLLEGDTVQPEISSTLEGVNLVSINKFGKQVIVVEEPIAFAVESTTDPNLPIGQVKIVTPGIKGSKVVTYELDLRDGKEVGRKKLQEIIASQPVTQVQIKGAKITNTADNVVLGQQMAAGRGWTGEQWLCLYQMWDRESHWNHLAANRSTGAYGIPQALPGSKMGSGWQTDPAVQISWGLGYIAGRYGSPCGAWNFWQVNHWY